MKSPKQVDAGCLCFTLLLALGCASGPSSIAQSALPQGISVSGHGEAQGQPDLARVTIGVEARSRVANEATEEVNQQMGAVIAAIQQQGVAEADIRTQSFSINFEQQPEPYPPGPYPGAGPAPTELERPSASSKPATPAPAQPADVPRGFYRVSNSAQVTVRDLAKLGAILGATTGAGANNIWGIEFEIEDPSKLEAEARQEAVAQAKARAEQLAQLAGVKLGRVVSLGESGGSMPSGRGYGYSMEAARADVPVQRGELTISQDVQIVFAIE